MYPGWRSLWKIPCCSGGKPDTIEACEGSVIDGWMVRARQLYAPWQASACRLGAGA